MGEQMSYTSDMERATTLQAILIDRATGNAWLINDNDYKYSSLRSHFVSDSLLRSVLPDFVVKCRELSHFGHYILQNFSHDYKRKEHIYSSLEPLFDAIEGSANAPHIIFTTEALQSCTSDEIQRHWSKALERINSDPDGAITMARTLLESVCHHILHTKGQSFEGDQITRLYDAAAATLNLAPNQHSQKVFKQILGGCASAIYGIGELRNKESDGHGKPKPYRAKPRHAEIAVNLAGAMALFLLRTLNND